MGNANGRKTTLFEYMDYATIHGIGRSKNTPYIVFKILWILALLASLGMVVWQVHGLYEKYESHPISTSVEVKTASELEFPTVTICNTNPAQYSKINIGSSLDDIIQRASEEYSVDLDIYNYTDMYDYNYTNYDVKNKNVSISNDILWKTAEQFRMTMATLDFYSLDNISQSVEEFILLCNFAGEDCTRSITPLRSYNYGMCYKFEPQKIKQLEPHGKVADAGPTYGLELLLNVDQSDSIPFVTSSVGVVVGTDAESLYFHENHGVFIPTGFETNIALSSVTKERVSGWKNEVRCKGSDYMYSTKSLLDCQKECKLLEIANKCGCYQFFFNIGYINASVPLNNTFDEETGFVPCYTEDHYMCIRQANVEFVREPAKACARCLPPCSESIFERDVSMTTWPGENFLPILRRIMQSRVHDVDLSIINRDYVRGNLAFVRIYLSSLSYHVIQEEYSYSEIDFISDIGGQLGLWAGFSVLSLLEVIELILLLCVHRRKDQKTNPENSNMSPDD